MIYFLKLIFISTRDVFYLFFFWIIDFGVPQIFHIIKVFPVFKKVKNHWFKLILITFDHREKIMKWKLA